jgi:hypothetical protein
LAERVTLFVRLWLGAALTAASLSSISAQTEEPAGLNALPQVELAQLSQVDRSPLGVKALSIHPTDWRHGETAHFIYHFQRSFVATATSVEAEFYFRVVGKALGKTEVPWPEKAHIYIFEAPADWESFQSVGGLEPWTGGIQSGGSLFIVRNPAYKFADNTLGHEISHLVLRRLYGNGIPLWLNEGFAEYASKGAQASFRRARGYNAKPLSGKVERDKLNPLDDKTAARGYPSDDKVDAFYTESERLVRFLVASDKEKFLELLQLCAAGQPFDTALFHASGALFPSVAELEEKFVAYAAADPAAPAQD